MAIIDLEAVRRCDCFVEVANKNHTKGSFWWGGISTVFLSFYIPSFAEIGPDDPGFVFNPELITGMKALIYLKDMHFYHSCTTYDG